MAGKLTPAQRQYVRKRTKIHELDPSEVAGELNIVPFLDIVVNLIMFLLMTTTTVLAISQIEAQLPQLSRGVGRRAQAPENALNLNITVTDQGVIVAGSGGKLAPGCQNTASGRVITVPKRLLPVMDPATHQPVSPRRQEMGYDWPALTECVARVHSVPDFQDETQVIVGADPMIQYENVINAMDAVRGRGTEELFPDVLLSAGVR